MNLGYAFGKGSAKAGIRVPAGRGIRPPSSRPSPPGEGELFADLRVFNDFSSRAILNSLRRFAARTAQRAIPTGLLK